MSLISELLSLREDQILTEAQLQSIVKKFSVPVGSFEKVFGELADQAAKMLRANSTDPVYELKGTDPQATQAIKSLSSQVFGDGERAEDTEMKIVKLIGSRMVLVWKHRVLMSKEQFDSLVESVAIDEAPLGPSKVWNAGNTGYLAPFRVSHSWVEDARRSSVCEAQDKKTANMLCDMLNAKYSAKGKS